ncbi:LytR/AlgR family response regulator transcription factor [Lysinibacillus antri]|uniref:Response regulator n=1 Tax=Lysinibacillus antri TaxID=2498145 RepID=A0A3S0R475_9BACI|nr:response regulator [Lysinibacillus antri]RUL48051.1 response regulator [Lysinibacillus antri]
MKGVFLQVLKVVIIGDEKLASSFLKMQLENTGLTQVIAEFCKPTIVINEILILKPDVVFLDIEKSGTNGIELGFKLLNKCPNLEIVNVSDYRQYADDEFKLKAIHYLLKSSTQEDIDEVIQRVLRKIEHKSRIVDEDGVRIELLGLFKIFFSNKEVQIKWATDKMEEFLH